jgi:hypothetical protein
VSHGQSMSSDVRVEPALSVVLATAGPYAVIRTAVANLTRQRGVPIELVIAGPTRAMHGLTEADRTALAAFASWQHVVVPAGADYDTARAWGVVSSLAPIVAFAEDHSFPQPGWAAALLDAFEHGWSGVGPVVENGNPGSLVSWASLMLEYGPWLSASAGRAVAHIPGHNSAYRREVLMAQGDRLGAMIEAESVLHWQLGREGHRFTIEPRARTRHVNFSRFWPSMELRFHVGRQFGSRRCRDWPAARRWIFAAATPLIPFVRLARVLGLPIARARPALVARTLPLLALLVVAATAGELAGYLSAGPGRSTDYLTDIETDRKRFMNEHDRASATW